MRIAWFTPFGIGGSAISKFSQSVTRELAELCSVDIWCPQHENLLPTNVNVIPFSSYRDAVAQMTAYDYVVYNMGDHLYYHLDIYEVMRRTPGIVIIHDFILHNFFRGYYIVHKDSTDHYLEKLQELYGQSGMDYGKETFRFTPETGLPVEGMSFPCFEPCLENAVGVVGHSAFSSQSFGKKALCPVTCIPLPHNNYSNSESVGTGGPSSILPIRKDRLLVASFGMINPNKRYHLILECLGRNKKKLAEKIQYVIIGGHDHLPAYFEKLKAIVDQYGLQETVHFTGYLSERVLHEYLSLADICINLRYPAGEGASASLVEAMYFGCPVIASDTGCYSEFPDDCIVKIQPGREEDLLFDVLHRLIENGTWRKDLSRNSRQYLHENLTPARYAQKFMSFLPEVDNAAPSLSAVRRVIDELRKMGVGPGHEAIKAISREVERFLF